MLRTRLVRRAARLLGAVTVAGVLLAGSAGAAQASAGDAANGIQPWDSSSYSQGFYFSFQDANGI
jgi:hypothetical protein